MLNPSTADAEQDDPTIRRCVGYAKAWGFGSYIAVNVAALMATDKKELTRHPNPFGLQNRFHIRASAASVAKIVVCCGSMWSRRGREEAFDVIAELQRSHSLYGLGEPRPRPTALAAARRAIETADGFPLHPLYKPARYVPQIYRERLM